MLKLYLRKPVLYKFKRKNAEKMIIIYLSAKLREFANFRDVNHRQTAKVLVSRKMQLFTSNTYETVAPTLSIRCFQTRSFRAAATFLVILNKYFTKLKENQIMFRG